GISRAYANSKIVVPITASFQAPKSAVASPLAVAASCLCQRWADTITDIRPIADTSAALNHSDEPACLAESNKARDTMATIAAAWNCHVGPVPNAKSRARTKQSAVVSKNVIALSRSNSRADSSSSNGRLLCATSRTGVDALFDMDYPQRQF